VSISLRSDWHATSKDAFMLDAGLAGADFNVPNNFLQQSAGQRQRQNLRNDREALTWRHNWSETTLTSVLAYRQFYRSERDGSPFDAPLSANQDRHQLRQGLLASLTQFWRGHTLQVGGQASHVSVEEEFSFAVTDPEAAEEASISPEALHFTP